MPKEAPFAAARSLLIEHGFGEVAIAAHGISTTTTGASKGCFFRAGDLMLNDVQ
jgi:hypothetical protein